MKHQVRDDSELSLTAGFQAEVKGHVFHAATLKLGLLLHQSLANQMQRLQRQEVISAASDELINS